MSLAWEKKFMDKETKKEFTDIKNIFKCHDNRFEKIETHGSRIIALETKFREV